jgi:hypothetical protein
VTQDERPSAAAAEQEHLPERVDRLGVLSRSGGRDTFVLLLAVVGALLALIFTLGWVVYHHMLVSHALGALSGWTA